MNAEQFNAMYPVGTAVFAYPDARPEDMPSATRLVTRTRSRAELFCGHTDVVWVDGHGACISLSFVDVVSEDEWQAARAAQQIAAVDSTPASADASSQAVERGGHKRLGHSTPAESVPALLATIKELRDLRQPLIEALRTVHQSMTSCVGDEWAEEWLGEVWSQLPLGVRALAGDQDATAEIAAEQGALPVPTGQGGVQ